MQSIFCRLTALHAILLLWLPLLCACASAHADVPPTVRDGVMTAYVAKRLTEMDARARTYGSLPDADVNWALGLLKTSPPSDTLGHRESLHIWAITHVTLCHGLTTSQKARVYRSCMKLIADRDDTDIVTCMLGLGQIHTSRAVPIIGGIAARHSSTSYVGKWARHILEKYFEAKKSREN